MSKEKTLVDQWVERDEALRELLSHLEQSAKWDCPSCGGSLEYHGDTANRLRNILDGEQ